MKFWWCLTHSTVESNAGDEVPCKSDNRLGPYPSREQAERAEASVRARTEAEDARDEADDDWGAK